MKKFVTNLAAIFAALNMYGQAGTAIKVPMAADKWLFAPNTTEFIQYKGVPAVKITSDTTTVMPKDITFTNGTIEFDVESTGSPFTGIYFRRQSKEESEYFYLRTERAGSPLAMDAIQYCPVIKGVTLWDMLPYYQAPAMIRNDWNHVKLVVSGAEMLVYVNDMNKAALQVPRLEANTLSGGIAFDGKSVFANLVITPGETNGLPPAEGFDPTYSDPRYIREWQVDSPIVFLFGKDVGGENLPAKNAVWTRISAERRGLVNLTRMFGGNKDRRLVWLKTTIHSDKEQVRKIDFGFSDEVWVVINGKLAYVDKNWFGHPVMKEPEGRCAVENTQFNLPLKAGDNELLIAVTNFFYGWGIIARFDKLDGINF